MLIRSGVIFAVLIAAVNSACDRDRNVQFQNPLYLNFGDGFFYVQGMSNGEAVVIYKHPDDTRIFGQYTFKDERCLYETVYYYVLNGKYEFTNPYVANEQSFNVTNKISFVRGGAGYEIEYSLSPRGVGIFQNLGQNAERKILPNASFKRTPSRPAREIYPNFANIGKQNMKVSYLRNGENFIQFIARRNQFSSIEGSYTFRASDRRYHTVVYEVPLDDFDYTGMSIKEYEIATEENFFRSGVLALNVNGTQMDVKFFVDRNGFHINDLQRPRPQGQPQQQQQRQQQRPVGVQRPFGPPFTAGRAPENNRPVPNNFVRPTRQNQRLLNPSFSRPDLLTGPNSIQAGR